MILPPLPREKLKSFFARGQTVKKVNFEGYQEPPRVNRWLSEVVGSNVVIIRAGPNFKEVLDEAHVKDNAIDSDRKNAFVSVAAFHLINLPSIEIIRSQVPKEET